MRIDHVGVAVPDLEAAIRLWNSLLGEKPEVEDVPTQKVRAATYPCGVELIAGAAVEKFLGSRGPGIHHVTLAVDDIEARLAALKAAGVRLIHPEPVPGAGGCRVAFVHPSATGGVLLELKEKP